MLIFNLVRKIEEIFILLDRHLENNSLFKDYQACNNQIKIYLKNNLNLQVRLKKFQEINILKRNYKLMIRLNKVRVKQFHKKK